MHDNFNTTYGRKKKLIEREFSVGSGDIADSVERVIKSTLI
jgi:hypothetical protein